MNFAWFPNLSGCLFVGEAVANPPNGVEVFRIATIGFEVFSEVEDEIIDGAGGGIYLISPDTLQDLFP